MAKDKTLKDQDKPVMEKCNYCADSSASGECRFVSESIREDHCKVAIQTMIRCLGGNKRENNR